MSRRRVPRFEMQMPVDVTILRSGVSDTLPGRSMNLGERGIAAVLAGELTPGETVTLDVSLWADAAPLHTTAAVRYHDKLRCGFEFISMSLEQKSAIREWTRSAKAEAKVGVSPAMAVKPAADPESTTSDKRIFNGEPPRPRMRVPKLVWPLLLVAVAITGVASWWRWNQGWKELESGIQRTNTEATEQPIQVPTEVMQKLLVHRVEPIYPAEAQAQNLEGIIAIDLIVSREGSVVRVKPINGPDELARAAMDALRWWKFSPYRVNGQAVTVETTMAVEFKR